MKLAEVIFTDNLPTLDLHGYDRDYARVKINEFINDNITMKNDIIAIVHGMGNGIIKQTTHQILSNNKKVSEFMLFYRNNGMTIVKLNIDK